MSDLVGNPEDRFSRVEAHLRNSFLVALTVFGQTLKENVFFYSILPQKFHKLQIEMLYYK